MANLEAQMEKDKTGPQARREIPQALQGRRRRYEPPRILSAEPLEAAAATCDPPSGGFGKSVPSCNIFGS